MKWSKQAWTAITPIYDRIIVMPFIRELISGELDKAKFTYYIQQDAIYLEHFGRALALVGARAQLVDDLLQFVRFAEGAIVVERALHAQYFQEFAIEGKGSISPICHHYTNFLKSTAALEQVEVAMAAVLPCFWIYKRVGDFIYGQTQIVHNPYQSWIDTYAGDEFGILTEKAIAIVDAAAERCTAFQREQMTEAFLFASRLEELFWQSAWDLGKWKS